MQGGKSGAGAAGRGPRVEHARLRRQRAASARPRVVAAMGQSRGLQGSARWGSAGECRVLPTDLLQKGWDALQTWLLHERCKHGCPFRWARRRLTMLCTPSKRAQPTLTAARMPSKMALPRAGPMGGRPGSSAAAVGGAWLPEAVRSGTARGRAPAGRGGPPPLPAAWPPSAAGRAGGGPAGVTAPVASSQSRCRLEAEEVGVEAAAPSPSSASQPLRPSSSDPPACSTPSLMGLGLLCCCTTPSIMRR